MLEAICAEPDITPLNIPVNAVPVIRPVVLLKTKDESPSRLPPSLNCICVLEPPAPASIGTPFCKINPNEPVEVDEPLTPAVTANKLLVLLKVKLELPPRLLPSLN